MSRNKYGSKAIFYTPGGTTLHRAGLTGEHRS
ncbi:impb/mucb/samb family protein [Bacillus amyloliquefaciens]|nr:impb/mucb/samb family protein [Bacillus amyloliquefaciens]NUI31266.1 impb/mucb/samb family protein [Bacillus amyloliquefaciens]NUI35181.1 impb/mucb/samb family protein [Bacillus amyloliquefaciens]NUI69029.1 impb/mucb/samb family protein [Bacillus amyloliquefaciens]NUI74432.1 impb/mucb/samb family protein [Bacillus amyloliquefaciens]